MPLRDRALVLRTETRQSRVSALAGFDPYRGRPAGLTPVRRAPGCAVDAQAAASAGTPSRMSRRPGMRTRPGAPRRPSRRRR